MFRMFAAVAALLVTTAEAQIPKSVASRLLEDVNVATLLPILDKQGLFPETATIAGQETVVLNSGDQVILLRPRVCQPDCKGLLMYVVIEGTVSSAEINAFNQQTPPTMVYTHGGNTVLSRYLIADHGITAGTFLVNLGVFDDTVEKWMKTQTVRTRYSVSLNGGQTTEVRDVEGEAFLDAVMRRPELFSGEIARDY